MHRHRSGFKQTEQFAFTQELAAEFSDSINSGSASLSSQASKDRMTVTEAFGSQGKFARKPSRFIQSTFRDSAGSKDDMAMPSRKTEDMRFSPVREEFQKNLVDSKSSLTLSSPNNSMDRKKPTNKSAPKRVISSDDSVLGSFVTPKLRPPPVDTQTVKQFVLANQLTSTLTTRQDLSNSLVAKLGSNAIENRGNKAAGRRRASVNVLTGLTSHNSVAHTEPLVGDRSKSRSRTPVRKGRSSSLGPRQRREIPKQSSASDEPMLNVVSLRDNSSGKGEHFVRRHRHHGYKDVDDNSRRRTRTHDHDKLQVDDESRRQGRPSEDSDDRRNHRLEHSRRTRGSPTKDGHGPHGSRSPGPGHDRHGDRDSRSPGSNHPRPTKGREDDKSHSPHETNRRRIGNRNPTEEDDHRQRIEKHRPRHGNRHPDPDASNQDSHHKSRSATRTKESGSPEQDRPRRRKPQETTVKGGGESEPSKESDRRTVDSKVDAELSKHGGGVDSEHSKESNRRTAESKADKAVAQQSPKLVGRRGRGSVAMLAPPPIQAASQKAASQKKSDGASRRSDEPRRHNEGNDRHGHQPRNESSHKGERSHKKLLRKRSNSTGNLTSYSHGDKARPTLGRRASSSEQIRSHEGDVTDSKDGKHHTRSNHSHKKDARALRYEAAATARAQGEKVTLSPRSRRLSVQALVKTGNAPVQKSGRIEQKLPRPLLTRRHRSDESATPAVQNRSAAERSDRHLTMDTGRRRSISPRVKGPPNPSSDQSKSSRFKEALLKKQESQEDSEKHTPEGRPALRRHSSLSKLETKSRMSLMVRDPTAQGPMLNRDRRMFLDEEISFSDSDEDADDDDRGEKLTKSARSNKRSQKDSAEFHAKDKYPIPKFDAEFSDPDFPEPYDNDTNIREIPPFHRLTANMDHIDLTALSASQAQLILARARNKAT